MTTSSAVVGMGLVVPGANNPDEFWKVLIDGPNLFRRVPEDRWDYRPFHSEDHDAEDKTYSASSVFITDFEPEPGLTDGLSGETDGDDSTALWLRHALLQALARRPPPRQSDRYNFVVGYTADGSQHLEESQVVAGMAHRLAEAMERADLPADEAAKLQAEIAEALRERYARGAEEPIRYLPHNVGRRAMEGVLPARHRAADGRHGLLVLALHRRHRRQGPAHGPPGHRRLRRLVQPRAAWFGAVLQAARPLGERHPAAARQGRRRRALLRRRRRRRPQAAQARAARTATRSSES